MELYNDNDKTRGVIAVSTCCRFSPPRPCAACRFLRRRCSDESCILAPYFPPNEPLKFINAHKVFGASNILKTLQELPESNRADAVSSMVYEANARIRDPVYGCAGSVSRLLKKLNELKADLAKAKADICIMQCQQLQQNADSRFFLHRYNLD